MYKCFTCDDGVMHKLHINVLCQDYASVGSCAHITLHKKVRCGQFIVGTDYLTDNYIILALYMFSLAHHFQSLCYGCCAIIVT